ncbi:hypothetical protein QQF64_031664 [Cirrhinus molitorella]|uniref:Uncharacterized protein n=1 Tax=Cirrhinus molitorella TaxID=172907 RepID=A0ABR3MXL2_9TELE
MDISRVAETERVCLRESLARLTLNYHSIKSSDSENHGVFRPRVYGRHVRLQNLPATSVERLGKKSQMVARGQFLLSPFAADGAGDFLLVL